MPPNYSTPPPSRPAACETVTVQVALAPGPKLAGLHVNPVTNSGATSEIVAVCALPLMVAVSVAVWLLAIVPAAVAVNVAVKLPAATVTDAGAVNAAALLDRNTCAPPAKAMLLSATVHTELPPGLNDVVAQLRLLKTGVEPVTVPPAPLIASVFPTASDAEAFITPIVELATPGASVAVTLAIAPFCMTALFMPVNIQI